MSDSARADPASGLAAWHRAVALDGRGGPVGPFVRAALAGASLVFRVGAGARAAMYDRGLLSAIHPGVPVIAVGNLTTGGTGKSPLVRWIATQLAAAGIVPGVVARGYGAREGQLGDELSELARALPGVVVVQDADRIRGAATAVARGAGAIVLDDAFQHRRIARDLDIVAVSARDPWGGGWLLPRGLLREPPWALARADHVVVTRADQVDGASLGALRARIGELAPDVPISVARHVPTAVRIAGEVATVTPAWLAGKVVWALSAIADPGAFERTLTSCGARLAGTSRFADHHPYVAAELSAVAGRARDAGAVAIATTAKDAARLPVVPCGLTVAVMEIALELDDPGPLAAAIGRVSRSTANSS